MPLELWRQIIHDFSRLYLDYDDISEWSLPRVEPFAILFVCRTWKVGI
jgi:hypothetical protein